MNNVIPSERYRTLSAQPPPLPSPVERPSSDAPEGVDELTPLAEEPPPTCLDLVEACGAGLFVDEPEAEDPPSRAVSLLLRGAFVALTVASLAAAAIVVVLLMSGRLADPPGSTGRTLRTGLCVAALLAWRSLLAHEAASLTRFLDGAGPRPVEAARALVVACGPLLFCVTVRPW